MHDNSVSTSLIDSFKVSDTMKTVEIRKKEKGKQKPKALFQVVKKGKNVIDNQPLLLWRKATKSATPRAQ